MLQTTRAFRSSRIMEANCPSFHDHTPDAPEGYIQWHAWAQRMNKTHKQTKCSGCSLYVIWIPKKKVAPHDD